MSGLIRTAICKNCILYSLLPKASTNFCNRCHDNGPEFKAEVKDLAQNLGIPIIRGRAYHPQSQGSIEIANRTFKRRLAAFQLAKGVTTWVDLLPELAMTINTTTSCALPRNKTPFEVWFGRKPHWITARTAQTNNQINQDNKDEDSDQDYHDDDSNQDNSNDEDLILTSVLNHPANDWMGLG